jgi:hypothetical protein
MSSKSQAQATTTDELMGYVYKVSCYESKRHRTSHTDVYYATPQDCQWALDSCDYKRGLIQIHLIQVKQSDMKYQSAHQNRKAQAEPEAAAAEPSDVSDVTFDGSALDEALQKDNLDWQFQRPTNGIEYSTVYIYEPAVDVETESEDESESEDEPEPEAETETEFSIKIPDSWKTIIDGDAEAMSYRNNIEEDYNDLYERVRYLMAETETAAAEPEAAAEAEATPDDQLLLEAEWRLQPDATDDELPEALRMIEEAEAEDEEDGFETIEEAEVEAEAPPPSTFECCVCLEEQVLSLQYPLPCSHGLCMGCYQDMFINRCNMKCPCCRGPLEENPTPRGHFVNNHLPIGQQIHPVNGDVMVQQRAQLMDVITDGQTNWSTTMAAASASPLNVDSYVASRTRMTSMTNFINNIDTRDELVGNWLPYIEMCQEHYLECQARGVPFVIQLDIGNTPGVEYTHAVSGNMWNDAPVARPTRPTRRARRCGFCHQTGHNRRTCSLRLNQ